MKEESLNKMLVKFKHKKKYYEIDWLTDGGNAGWMVFEVFQGRGKGATSYGQYMSRTKNKRELKRKALLVIQDYLKENEI